MNFATLFFLGALILRLPTLIQCAPNNRLSNSNSDEALFWNGNKPGTFTRAGGRKIDGDWGVRHLFDHMLVFGDSHTDNGVEPERKIHGFRRASNGPVWSDYLAKKLRIPAHAVENFAYSGALSGEGNYYFANWSGILWQIEKLDKVPDNALVALQAGGTNDLFVGADTDADFSASVVENNLIALRRLAEKGAKHIFYINLSDCTLMPGFNEEPYLSQKSTVQKRLSDVNRQLSSTTTPQLRQEFPDLSVIQLDWQKGWDSITSGFLNTTAPFSYHSKGLAESEQWEHVWFDQWHITTSVHKRIAEHAFQIMLSKKPLSR